MQDSLALKYGSHLNSTSTYIHRKNALPPAHQSLVRNVSKL